MNDGWIWWVAASLALIVVEVLSLDLVLVMFAAGALVAGGGAALGWPLPVQILAFAAVAVLLLFALRPWLLKHLRHRTKLEETNTVAQIGRIAVVVTDVDQNGGRIKLMGEVWTARTDDATPILAGQDAEVLKIEGATAVVGALKNSATS